MKYQLLPLLGTIALFAHCATVPIPLPTVPQKGNQALISAAGGTNGVNLNVAYVTKNRIVPNVSLQYRSSFMYDIGLGAEIVRDKILIMMTYGYGRQSYFPISNGLYQAINCKEGTATRWSIYMNSKPAKALYFNLRFSKYSGQISYQRNGSYYYGHTSTGSFSTIGLEPALFVKFKGLFIGIGGGIYKELMFKYEKDLFDPWPLWLGVGYQFQVKI